MDKDDAFCLMETFLTPNVETEFLKPIFPNHEFFRTDRDTKVIGGKQKKGGTLIGVPSYLNVSKVEKLSNGFTEATKVYIEDINMTIICGYVPGDTPIKEFFEFINFVYNIANQDQSRNLVLAGDFNMAPPIVEWIDDKEEGFFPVIS